MARLCVAARCRGRADVATGQSQRLLGFSREIVGNNQRDFLLRESHKMEQNDSSSSWV